jgi:hypothetical protein
MSSELRVPALKAQARRMVEDWEGPQIGSKPAMIAVMKDLLAVHEAQAARLAEAQTAGDADPALYHDMESLRRRAPFAYGQWRADLAFLLETVDAQAARLAAVSDALMYAISIICNVEQPTVTQDVPWEPLRRRFLDQAHAALGPPAAERAPRTEAPGAPAGEEP